MPLALRGTLNQAVLDILEANVREPLQVRGDLHSLAACNEMGCRRLLEMMDEFALSDLSELAAVVIANSHAAMLAEIGKLPMGTYRHSMVVDGFEQPIELHANMQVRSNGIHVDYTGTSPCSARGINVPVAYTMAYTAFGIRCMVGAGILNNAGSLAPITIHAPENCILNAPRPRAVSARQVVGQMLPDLLFGCLHQVVAGGAPAEGAASLWSVPLFGGPGIGVDSDGAPTGRPFTVMGILAGGTGARPRQDGLSATAFPSRVRGIPIEILETLAPIVFWTKELRPDSGGAGEHRGGLGQIVEIGCLEDVAFAMSPGTCDRILYPARGRDGGGPGASGWIGLASGRRFEDKFRHTIPPGDRLVMLLPGGGGFGRPARRAAAALERDMRYGFVSADAALHDYDRAPDTLARNDDKDSQ